jgi:hypothetical protein
MSNKQGSQQVPPKALDSQPGKKEWVGPDVELLPMTESETGTPALFFDGALYYS